MTNGSFFGPDFYAVLKNGLYQYSLSILGPFKFFLMIQIVHIIDFVVKISTIKNHVDGGTIQYCFIT